MEVSDKITKALSFLRRHDTAVLSTYNDRYGVSGAPMYYTVRSDDYVYVLTKSTTQKARNMMRHHSVAFTIYDAERLQTLQLQAEAELVHDWQTAEAVYHEIMKPHEAAHGKMPPVASIKNGAFVVFRLVPSVINYSDFGSWE